MHRPPLCGRRVVELGTMLAAPFAAHILSQLGAEIIKVEPPSGDPTRSLVRGGPSGTFIAYSHGKKSVCIDLSNPEGHAAFCKLLKTQLRGRPEREPHGEFSMPGYGAYQTCDKRWIYLLMLNDNHWLKFCQAMELPGDESLATLRQRKKVREKVEDLVKAAVAAHSFDTVATRFRAVGLGFTEVLPLERVLDAPQARHSGKLREIHFR